MEFEPGSFPKVLTLYLELSQYPILAGRVRERMRRELFEKAVVTREAFENEVREKAIQSQEREGLKDPYGEEAPEIWSMRLAIVRDQLTDFYFAYNFPHERFEELVREVLAERDPTQEVVLTFHPELAPWDMLFAQGERYESLPLEERVQVEHHLQEIKVVLIKSMISDHLRYLGIAKKWFDIGDLKAIRRARIGRGKIGGKAAGIKLAEVILRKAAGEALQARLHVPRSWFLGADAFYQFTQMNGLLGFANQKYKTEEEIRGDYADIVAAFGRGRFPDEIVDGLNDILGEVGGTPLIVRSSSLLEDSFGTSFAGKYESFFCANQDSREGNLKALLGAIQRVYASVYSADVLLYRRRRGLIDYDERMAILIQEVEGRQLNGYFLPDAAGVAFSRNQFRWNPRIDRKAGFLRLVWGLGTRSVETIGGDYPRLVALSHPDLRPESDPKGVRRYSQHQVDVIDLEANTFRTAQVQELLKIPVPNLRWIAQQYENGDIHDFFTRPGRVDSQDIVLTFDGLLRRTEFPGLMRNMLETLELAYEVPVDVEFAVLFEARADKPSPQIYLLQCRPQSRMEMEQVQLPKGVPKERRLFVVRGLVPDGRLSDIRYAVYVTAEGYARLSGSSQRKELAQLIGRINKRLSGETFMLIGPGRWGSANPELGIPVTYADIYGAGALVEVFGHEAAPEPSYGTHFFQDLVEAGIYPLALGLDDPSAEFNRALLLQAPNALEPMLPDNASWATTVTLVDFPAAYNGARLELVMDGDAETAIAFLKQPARG